MTLPAVLLSLILHLASGAPLPADEVDTAPYADAAPAFAWQWDDPATCGEDWCWLEVGQADSGALVLAWNGSR